MKENNNIIINSREEAKNKSCFSRRNFLSKLVKASVLAGAAVSAGKYFQDRNITLLEEPVLTVPGFDVPDTAGLFAVARGKNPYLLTETAVRAIGGMGRFIKKGDKVLIKANCAFARPAWMGATSSPEVVAATVKLCYQAGAVQVKVTDNPINAAKSCFLKSGVGQATEAAGGKIILPQVSDFKQVKVNEGLIKSWEIYYEPLNWCDKLIGIPTVKTHNLCGASLAMKNWYGFFGGSRSRFHQDIDRVITELAAFITPTLVILDGTRMMVKNGPTGGSVQDVVAGNTVAVSTDQVAIDSFGIDLLDLDKDKVPYINMAAEQGLGSPDYRNMPFFREVGV